MANNYESLKTDGHYTMARRIFTKIKSWVEGKVQTNVPANAVFTDTTYTAGDNVSISNQNVISADQVDDSYDYDDYQDLPSATKMQDKIFIVDDCPEPEYYHYDPVTKMLIFESGFAEYDPVTKTLSI